MARLIGISPNALRMRIRNGNKDGLEFAVINGKVFFKRPRPNQVIRPPDRHPATQASLQYSQSLKNGPRSRDHFPTKQRQRGNHFNQPYNFKNGFSFKQKNAIRMQAKINGELDPEVIDLIPEAIKEVKMKRVAEANRLSQPPKVYTSGIYSESHKGYGSPEYHAWNAHLITPSKFRGSKKVTLKPKKYYW